MVRLPIEPDYNLSSHTHTWMQPDSKQFVHVTFLNCTGNSSGVSSWIVMIAALIKLIKFQTWNLKYHI